jgi:UDP-glucose 6-dehydrogenase
LNSENPTQIAVLGTRLGHRVPGINREQHKVDNVLNGRAPFYEPGLDELVRENTAAGRLSASNLADGIGD